jgi:exo-rhamnogalacturonan lyase-like protein
VRPVRATLAVAAISMSLAGCASQEAVRDGARAVRPLASSSPRAEVPSDPCPEASIRFEQPIAVVEDLKLARRPAVVGFPIPFARDAGVHSLTGFFAATPDGVPLPTQMEVLSRWGDGPLGCDAPIRWAYGWVLADVPPGARSMLVLRHDPKASHSSARTPDLRIIETEDQVTVDTGAARFTVGKRHFTGASTSSATAGAGLFVERGRERFSAAEGDLAAFEIERNGPHLATIAVKGKYGNARGAKIFRYTVRLHFYAGSGAVAIDHTYYNGALANLGAKGGRNRAVSDRVYMRIPIALGGEDVEVFARIASKIHAIKPRAPVSIEQQKRTPSRPDVVSAVTHGRQTLELGTFADAPMIAVSSKTRSRWAIATIGDMGPRDPQAIRFDPATGALEIDWQSEELHVGGGRGIWSRAVVEIGDGEARSAELGERAKALQAHASRPLIGVPSAAYLNGTRARASVPERALSADDRAFDEEIDRIHDATAAYLRKERITGTQIWPDLPRHTCRGESCLADEKSYFEGGDANYWDWSLVELQEFLRTADPSFLFDFAIPEAITMAETVSFRPDDSTSKSASSFAGFSPCYGGARREDGAWVEGLNHRLGACPGDYSYNKVHALAYVLTADRRFTDFFTEGAETAIRMYGYPPRTPPDRWLELSASRTTYQYLEPLLDAAEFSRIGGDSSNRRYRDAAIADFDHLGGRALERGHTCNLLGTGEDDPKRAGSCTSDQAWMTPGWIEWVARLASLYQHGPARDWLLEFSRTSADHLTVEDARGLPDVDERDAKSSDDARNGWRTQYRCEAHRSGIADETCRRVTTLENEAYFYPNGLVAYLNAHGVVLDAIQGDPLHLCRWLPKAYRTALHAMIESTSESVWGKELGQAYALTATTLAAIERCGLTRPPAAESKGSSRKKAAGP